MPSSSLGVPGGRPASTCLGIWSLGGCHASACSGIHQSRGPRRSTCLDLPRDPIIRRLSCLDLPGDSISRRLSHLNLPGDLHPDPSMPGSRLQQYWVGLRGCNLNSLLVCPPQMGIDTMMLSNPSLCPETGNLRK